MVAIFCTKSGANADTDSIPNQPAVKCTAADSPESCKASFVSVEGYSAGGRMMRITNGLKVSKSTEKNSCPSGWKIWSPRNKNDWTLVYNSLGKAIENYPRKPFLIVGVTRNANGCDGCKNYAMNSNVPEQSSWKTSDGSAWWLRDSNFKELSGDYDANCYLDVANVDPHDVHMNARRCFVHSTDYLCQPVACTSVHDNFC